MGPTNYGCGGTYTEPQNEEIPQIMPADEPEDDNDTDEYVEMPYEDDIPPIK